MSHAPVRRKRRGGHEEEHENHERWLVSYADMITVLMALFIVLYAMSQVDESKYEQLRESLQAGFGHSSSILNQGSSALEHRQASAVPGAAYDAMLSEIPEEHRDIVQQIVATSDRLRNERTYGEARSEAKRLLEVWRRIDRQLRKEGLRGDVRATIDERGLVVSLVSQHVVFEPNVAELSPRGRRVVDTLAPILRTLTEPIELDGHTNQEPVKPKYFPTDWELSSARAVHVLRRLEEVHRMPTSRLRATGFGHTRPLIDPAVAGSQKVNKRVDIVVLSQAPAETRALMGEAYDEVRREAGLDDPATTDERPTAAARPDGTSNGTGNGTVAGSATSSAAALNPIAAGRPSLSQEDPS